TAALLPFLKSVPAAAQTTGAPKRLVLFYTSNGTIHDRWLPAGTATDWRLSEILSPLVGYENRINVIDGIDMASAGVGPGDDHARCMANLWTGTETVELAPIGTVPVYSGGGISVDQHIAKAIGGATRFSSLELGVETGSGIFGAMSYAGRAQPVPSEQTPAAAFDRVFSGLTGTTPDATAVLREQRRSVLDSLTSDFTRLRNRISIDDRPQLDAHLEAIFDIERRLGLPNDSETAACVPPQLIGDDGGFEAVGRLHTDILVAALACDATRVASLQWSQTLSYTVFSWLGLSESHHALGHSGSAGEPGVTAINHWYAERFAYLLDKLAGVTEGDRKLLDNCLVVWGNDMGYGHTHSRSNVPFVLAGSAGATVLTGRLLRYGGKPHNDLLVSVCNAMGLSTTTFGDPEFCNGPLPGLV
ncbi:MAG TPA: DUF1552 domain-containing protein, partial [Myxococcota bacterium]|nr:DUF1552 domain-containing protein [Myxococcota bacterium]